LSPTEVEDRLLAHPSVSQAIVVAAADADGSRNQWPTVILSPGRAATEDELVEFCARACRRSSGPARSSSSAATDHVDRQDSPVELRQMAATVLIEPQEVG